MIQIGMVRIGFATGISTAGYIGLVINILITAFVILLGIALISILKIKAPVFDKAIMIFYFVVFLSVNVWLYYALCHSEPIEVPQYTIAITEDTDIKEITDNYTVDRIEDGKIIFH